MRKILISTVGLTKPRKYREMGVNFTPTLLLCPFSKPSSHEKKS